MNKGIYADWAATAPLHPAAKAELQQWLEEGTPANPSSVHSYGMAAADRMTAARKAIAEAAGWDGEITFVSGGTEGLALAVYTLVQRSLEGGRRRVILSPLEHPAVREAVHTFAIPAGMTIEICTATPDGTIDLTDLAARLNDDVGFCAVMTVQNETGVIHPIEKCAALAHNSGAWLLTDAVQAAGHIPLSTDADIMVISGHKFGAPAGTGALFHRFPLSPLQKGGGQEHGGRGGTENLPGICAMAAAASQWKDPSPAQWMAPLRNALEDELICRLAEHGMTARILGKHSRRIDSVSSILFPSGLLGETLVLACDLAGLALSAGSACHSDSPEPSPALLAMGLSPAEAVRAVRLSFGFGTDPAEMEAAYRILGDTALRLWK